MMRRAQPQAGAEKLAPHPHRIELSGSIGELDYPQICANCGEPASQSVWVRKPFVRSYSGSDSSTDFRIGAALVPYCGACIAEHRREPDALPPLRRVLACFGAGEMLGAVGSTLFALFLLKEALQDLNRHPQGAIALLAFASVMGMIGWGSYRAARNKTEPFVIPAQSNVTTAFDFSDDLSGPYEPERRIYAMRNEQFAAAFTALNGHKTWDPEGPVARRSNRLFWITVGLTIVAAGALWLWE